MGASAEVDDHLNLTGRLQSDDTLDADETLRFSVRPQRSGRGVIYAYVHWNDAHGGLESCAAFDFEVASS